jgi:hypothetical protein
VWTGSRLWNTPTGVAVITNDNPKSGVVLTVVPSSVTTEEAAEGLPSWLPWLLLLAGIGIVVAIVLVWRSRRAAETVDGPAAGPAAPPPPPGPDSPPPSPGEETSVVDEPVPPPR